MAKYREPKVAKNKRVSKEASLRFWKVFLFEGTMFLLASGLAVFCAIKLNWLSQSQEAYLPQSNLQDFLFSFLFVTFFIVLFAIYKKAGRLKAIIYKALFLITVLWGSMTVLDLFFPVFGSLLITGVFIFIWLKFSKIWTHNVLIILGLAGAASFFGLGFTPSVAVALLLIFSAYDFVAVYKTKHMVLMAKEMIEKKVIFGFIIPKSIKQFNDELKQVKPGGNFMVLGGGDVIFPSLLAVSMVPFHPIRAWIVVAFSLVGLLFSFWIFSNQDEEGEKSPMPALPPIALFTIIGYLLTLVL